LAVAKYGGLFNSLLFRSELYRLGGLNSIRGFNENEFFAVWYAIASIEQRLYFQESSFLFLFADYARINEGKDGDFSVLGAGAGLSFLTQAGVFSLVYALGESPTQRFNPTFSKIHFGISSRF
jgi:outer membrane protein assembly factor BamA